MSSTFSRLCDQPFRPQPEHLAALHKSFPHEGWLTWVPGQPIPGGLDNAGAWFLTYVCTRPQQPLRFAELSYQRRADLNPVELELARADQQLQNNRHSLRKATTDDARQRLTLLVAAGEERLQQARAAFNEQFAQRWHAWEHHDETLLSGITTHQPETTTTEQEEEQLPDLLDDHEHAGDCDLLDDCDLLG